jgi:hypothetical protein
MHEAVVVLVVVVDLGEEVEGGRVGVEWLRPSR